MPSAWTPQTSQLKAANLQNADGTPVYAAGVWSLENSSGTTTFTVSDAGAVTVGPSSGVTSAASAIINGSANNTGSLEINVTGGTSKGYAGVFSDTLYLSAGGVYRGSWTHDSSRAIAVINLVAGNADSSITFQTMSANTGSPVPAGAVNKYGAWTLGPSSGLTTPHIIQNNSVATTNYILTLKKLTANAGANSTLYQRFIGADSNEDGYIGNNGSAVLGCYDVSDVRWKENIRNASYGLSTIKALRPVEFDWKTGIKNVKGFIAQEVKEVLPESVSIHESNGLEDAHFLETHTMIPVLVKAVQEQQAIIEDLKTRLAALEAKP
jgi:hypothetical protein